MNDPVTQNAISGGVAYTAGQVAATSGAMMLGGHPEAFILGLIGAVAICAWQEQFDRRIKTYAGVFFSMLLAGYGSPVAANWIHAYFHFVDPESLFYLLPLVIGALVPVIVPVAIKFLNSRYGGGNA